VKGVPKMMCMLANLSSSFVKGHTGRGTRKAMGQHAVNILDG
jgi:hypothetical protein